MPAEPARQFRYFEFVMVAFVVVLVCSNLIGPAKAAQIQLPWWGPVTFGAGVLFFPISYVFGDILTEVYGYARARRVVWAGFAAEVFAAVMATVVLAFPPAEGWPHQAALETAFGGTPRIVAASLTAYFCGEFCNSYTLARMKVLTAGRFLWLRTIGSTVAGEGIDSLVFYPLAFYGVWTSDQIIEVLFTNYALKVGWEAAMTPFTYRIVNFLKRAENEDYYDRTTDFTPFSLQT